MATSANPPVRRGERGMSLVELMFAMAILSVVLGAVYSIFFSGLKVYWKGDIMTQTQQGGRLATDRLGRDLRQAMQVCQSTAAACQPTGTTFSFDTVCTGNSQISFVQPALGTITLVNPDGSTSPIFATVTGTANTIPTPGYYVSYYLSGPGRPATGATPPASNATGPYLIKVTYTVAPATPAGMQWTVLAGNVTGLVIADPLNGGACPTVTSAEVQLTVTAFQNARGQNVQATHQLFQSITLRLQ